MEIVGAIVLGVLWALEWEWQTSTASNPSKT